MPLEIVREGSPKFDKKYWSYVFKKNGETTCFANLCDGKYTFSWDGKVDFSDLENIALQKVSEVLSINRDISKENKSKVKTLLTYSEGENDVSLEFDFSKPKPNDLELYKILTENDYHEIISARYDLRFDDFQYTFTAENSEHPYIIKENNSSEITITQPYSQPFTRSLFKWILETHKHSNELKNLDVESSTKQIKKTLKI